MMVGCGRCLSMDMLYDGVRYVMGRYLGGRFAFVFVVGAGEWCRVVDGFVEQMNSICGKVDEFGD